MGRKLYPPYIDGKIPAFCKSSDGEATLRVPFRQNRAVSPIQYKGMALKLKTVSNNDHKWTIKCFGESAIQVDPFTGTYYADFYLSTNKEGSEDTYINDLTIGVYYKVQLAYIDQDDVIGYFSDVGVVKYTSTPEIKILQLMDQSSVHSAQYNYTGVYAQEGSDKDMSEKEYSYRFTIVDENDNIFLDSGEQIHNSQMDVVNYESKDEFRCNKELKTNKKYRITYTVTTINGLVVSSPSYYIVKKNTIHPSLNATLHAESNFDNGYIKVWLQPEDDSSTSGSFSISRSSSKDNFETWNEICQFSLSKETPTRDLFNDFTVEQGVRYCYSIQQFNTKGLYSSRIISETVTADFEDMFLYDGERQLKVRFNPNVSSFKNDILESKVDTLGSKYPFIFRNGNVWYKEFPISGLISHLMDEQEFFMKKHMLGSADYLIIDLVSENIKTEREFKLEVLEWLNNGKAKLFRSPTEGNYLVRLLNVSLAPSAPLGRMLHTFNATAYEVAAVNYDNLISQGLFIVPNFVSSVMHLGTLDLTGLKSIIPTTIGSDGKTTVIPDADELVSIDFNEDKMLPLPYIYLGEFNNLPSGSIIGLKYNETVNGTNMVFITIGRTRIYEINSKDNPVIGVYLVWTPEYERVNDVVSEAWSGLLTYSYYDNSTTGDFDDIVNFENTDELGQFIGKHNNILKDAYVVDDLSEEDAVVIKSKNNLEHNAGVDNHFIWGIEDIRTDISRFYWLKFTVRDVIEFYYNSTDGRIYKDESYLRPFLYDEIVDTNVYKMLGTDPIRYYDGRDLKSFGIKETEEEGGALPYQMSYVTFLGTELFTKESQVVSINGRSVVKNEYYWTDETTDAWSEDDPIEVDRLYKFSINHQDNNVDLKTIQEYIITDLENVTSISLGRMLMLDCYYQKITKEFSVEQDPFNHELYFDNDSQNDGAKNQYMMALNSFEAAMNASTSDNGEIAEQYEIDDLTNSIYRYYRSYINYLTAAIQGIGTE